MAKNKEGLCSDSNELKLLLLHFPHCGFIITENDTQFSDSDATDCAVWSPFTPLAADGRLSGSQSPPRLPVSSPSKQAKQPNSVQKQEKNTPLYVCEWVA